jgi:hypothetical protein
VPVLLPLASEPDPPPVRLGTLLPNVGGELLAVGGLLGNEGTPVTDGATPPLLPALFDAAGVTTVVGPPSPDGMTTGVPEMLCRPDCAAPLVVPVWGDCVEVVPVSERLPPAPTILPTGPSGSTQTTSRLEQ